MSNSRCKILVEIAHSKKDHVIFLLSMRIANAISDFQYDRFSTAESRLSYGRKTFV